MDWRHRLRPLAVRPSIRAGVPKSLVDHLLLDAPLAPGASMLDAGCRSGKLVRALGELGFDVCGAALTPSDFLAASRRAPDARIQLLDERGWSAFPVAGFSRVIARDLLPVGDSRLSPASRRLVADWLRLVAPGGELVVVESVRGRGVEKSHRRECTLGLLGCFGSKTRLAVVRGGWWSGGFGLSRTAAEFVCTHLRVPSHPVAEDHWKCLDEALGRPSHPCCADFVPEEIPPAGVGDGSADPAPLRRAA